MSELERLARVLCDADPKSPEPDAPIYSGMKPCKAWEARVPLVRAILDALREPTPEMIDAGWGVMLSYTDEEIRKRAQDVVGDTLKAVLDSILNEERK